MPRISVFLFVGFVSIIEVLITETIYIKRLYEK